MEKEIVGRKGGRAARVNDRFFILLSLISVLLTESSLFFSLCKSLTINI